MPAICCDPLRMIKTKPELDLGLREATSTDPALDAGRSRAARQRDVEISEIIERLRRRKRRASLGFEYCLLTLATVHISRRVRARTWNRSEVMSIDSGGNLHGYIGDTAAWAFCWQTGHGV